MVLNSFWLVGQLNLQPSTGCFNSCSNESLFVYEDGANFDLENCARQNLARFPDPLAFGSGSGLQCVYTVVISL